jgi:hypothetical protein
MEQHQLSKREYEELHKIIAAKRSVRELLESLRLQLSSAIIQEDKWWRKMAKKYDLDTKEIAYSVNHNTQEIVGVPKPKKPEPPVQSIQQVPTIQQVGEEPKIISEEELEALRKTRGGH